MKVYERPVTGDRTLHTSKYVEISQYMRLYGDVLCHLHV